MKTINVGSDFSGVGAFDQALIRLGIKYNTVFACDMDKYARQTYIHNYGEPDYFPMDVYDREIPTDPLDIYMTSPPCQAFSLAGKRKGEEDKRGILFYNSHEFIKINRPRYFIFENVKGLLSDDNGKTFRRWCEYLGGKSINGNPIIFPHEESVPYHIYYKVLNAKNYNIPQNRERVFIVGIRDDEDNDFSWPKEIFLERRLRDLLENDVDEKYYLSDKMIEGLVKHKERHEEKGTGFKWEPRDLNGTASCLRANAALAPTDNTIKVKSATSKVFEIAEIGEDSINLEHPNSETRRGRVGDKVAQTLTTSCNQGVATYDTPKVKFQLTGGKWDKTHEQSGRVYDENGIAPTIHTMAGGNQEPKIAIGAIRGRNPDNPTSRQAGLPTQQMLEINENGTSNALTTVQKDNVVVQIGINDRIHGWHENENVIAGHRNDSKRSTVSEHVYHKKDGICTTIQTAHVPKLADFRIRKLTPRECFRLMDFPETFTWPVSDSQAYKQAGNSICVGVLAGIISKLNI